MRIGEAADLVGISRKTIHHYIQRGLISPEAQDNGYFDLGEKDAERLAHIRSLRHLGFSLDEIASVLDRDDALRYHFARRLKELVTLQRQTAWQIDWVRRVVSACSLDLPSKPVFDPQLAPRPAKLDESDATLILTYVWGTFMHGLEMTQYRRFLWERMCELILERQDPYLFDLRDYLMGLSNEEFGVVFKGYDDHLSQLIDLEKDNVSQLAEAALDRVEERLRDARFMRRWAERYEGLVLPATRLYQDQEYFSLMRELSDRIQRFFDNASLLDAAMWERLCAPERRPLARRIEGGLSEPAERLRKLRGLITFWLFC